MHVDLYLCIASNKHIVTSLIQLQIDLHVPGGPFVAQCCNFGRFEEYNNKILQD